MSDVTNDPKPGTLNSRNLGIPELAEPYRPWTLWDVNPACLSWLLLVAMVLDVPRISAALLGNLMPWSCDFCHLGHLCLFDDTLDIGLRPSDTSKNLMITPARASFEQWEGLGASTFWKKSNSGYFWSESCNTLCTESCKSFWTTESHAVFWVFAPVCNGEILKNELVSLGGGGTLF